MQKSKLKVSPIKKFHITEKASTMSGEGVYAFEVTKDSTKNQISKEVTKLYKVVPVKVNIVSGKAKKVIARGKVGKTNAVKKAYVFLKKGDTIDIA